MSVISRKTYLSKGFTIVEITVVIVVIGLLATITGFSYRGIQNNTYDTTVQSDVRSFGSKIEAYATKNGDYPRNATQMNSIEVKLSTSSYSLGERSLKYCLNGSKFIIAGESKSGSNYYYSNSVGMKMRTGGEANDWCAVNYDMPLQSGRIAMWTTVTTPWSDANRAQQP